MNWLFHVLIYVIIIYMAALPLKTIVLWNDKEMLSNKLFLPVILDQNLGDNTLPTGRLLIGFLWSTCINRLLIDSLSLTLLHGLLIGSLEQFIIICYLM